MAVRDRIVLILSPNLDKPLNFSRTKFLHFKYESLKGLKRTFLALRFYNSKCMPSGLFDIEGLTKKIITTVLKKEYRRVWGARHVYGLW